MHALRPMRSCAPMNRRYRRGLSYRDSPPAPPPSCGRSLGPAIMAMVENSFNFNVHGRAGFAALADVIDRSSCYEFTYSNLLDASAALEELASATR